MRTPYQGDHYFSICDSRPAAEAGAFNLGQGCCCGRPAFESGSFNLEELAGPQHARPHGEEARAARRLEPWPQVRTRGHPSRRPRHSASKTRVTALMARAPQDEVGVVKDSQTRGTTARKAFICFTLRQRAGVSRSPAAVRMRSAEALACRTILSTS